MFCPWLQKVQTAASPFLLNSAPPFVNLELLLFLHKETEFHIDAVELALQGSPGACHSSCASIQRGVDVFQNVDSLTVVNGLHSHSGCSKESCVFRLNLVSKYEAWWSPVGRGGTALAFAGSVSRSLVSDSLRPCGLYSLWNSPGQKMGVGSLSLLQGIFPTQESNPDLLPCGQILYQLSYQGSLSLC